MKKTIELVMNMKKAGKRITMLTCYDYPTAVMQEKAGVDVIFVGDSVGTNMLGYESAVEVTMDDMLHHLKAVRRGVKDALLLADMPYRSYETDEIALQNARLFIQAGADAVKLEGREELVVEYLTKNNIDVVGHLGFTPQTHDKASVQGKTFEQAKELLESALSLEKAGIKLLVLEMVPEEVAGLISKQLKIPTIGIAAGRYCDGQVQVINDLLGMTQRKLVHVKEYADYKTSTFQAVKSYKDEVENGLFPEKNNVRIMDSGELQEFKALFG
ncbi:3-methyl-2-oxobutanoate hydroxymethyltransferase [Desulfosporosinus orientis DSM 765]|uniref:3-methyl-2-oxobutanoate hydroxymethyltransferase n=1 Tax=Desulfosporosinus orientis (strain ATCC 19365 / DSM 765 / NCIMB 8382 / VKM B-1628 / Singapore I) TaxID=768706 RepID=G7WIS2_DESOD|nr:3-methyl-2-oxobutanoate hydroxymethyltransferase [Desulfosporosinus orientis]AET69146.1 3-methyl-2-oxobutanoate hydroxymethyltransferase [Desulfosporosinus orientis DSM 765]